MSTINIEFNLPETKVIKTENDERGNILITVETTEDHAECAKRKFISAMELIESAN